MMLHISKLQAAVFATALAAAPALASQEGALWLSRFRLESEAAAPSSAVVVEGRCSAAGKFESLEIAAYGRRHRLTPQHLKLLEGMSSNGIRLTEDPGSAAMGGRCVRIELTLGFPRETYRSVVVNVWESGKIEVEKASETPPKAN